MCIYLAMTWREKNTAVGSKQRAGAHLGCKFRTGNHVQILLQELA